MTAQEACEAPHGRRQLECAAGGSCRSPERFLQTDPAELLITRRVLSLRAEWLLDRLRLWATASGQRHFAPADLPTIVDGKLAGEQLKSALDELARRSLLRRWPLSIELVSWVGER